MTPGGVNLLGFSPGANFGSPNYYASPAHYHASPGYQSPTGQSPIYTGGQAMNVTSPQYMAASPIYQGPLTSQRQGPGALYAQSNRTGAGQNASPKYSPNALQSPMIGGYNPNMCSSPVYMPGMNGSAIPNTKQGGIPGSVAGKSPAYSPTQNMKQLISPGGRVGPSPLGAAGLRASPSYSPTAMNKPGAFPYTPNASYPIKTPKSDEPISTPDLVKSPVAAGPGQMETPIGPIQSPAYNPLSSPDYHPNAVTHTPQAHDDAERRGTTAAGSGSLSTYQPSSPMYQLPDQSGAQK